MARIELRHCDVILQDGLSGSAAVNQATTPPAADDIALTIDTTVLNTKNPQLVPIGARFTIAGETDAKAVHTVTSRTPATAGPTTEIGFSPALGAGTYADGAILTFLPQELSVKIGDGNLTYDESNEYEYLLDRDVLDTVREGKDVPMDVKLDGVYEHITQGTGEPVSPMDAMKGIGGAEEWVSASPDLCEPYCINIAVRHKPPCGTAQRENTTLPMFRAEKKSIDFSKATISFSGKCKATEALVERV